MTTSDRIEARIALINGYREARKHPLIPLDTPEHIISKLIRGIRRGETRDLLAEAERRKRVYAALNLAVGIALIVSIVTVGLTLALSHHRVIMRSYDDWQPPIVQPVTLRDC
jgi:hypothetical protein